MTHKSKNIDNLRLNESTTSAYLENSYRQGPISVQPIQNLNPNSVSGYVRIASAASADTNESFQAPADISVETMWQTNTNIKQKILSPNQKIFNPKYFSKGPSHSYLNDQQAN